MKRTALKRTGTLSRRRKTRLYDPDKEARLEWKRGRHVCVVCSRSQANGVIVDCHHVLPQRVLRRWVTDQIIAGLIDPADKPLVLRRILWDRRNRMALCRPHHNAVETRNLVLTREQVQQETWEFAHELGLEWWLERFCNGEANTGASYNDSREAC